MTHKTTSKYLDSPDRFVANKNSEQTSSSLDQLRIHRRKLERSLLEYGRVTSDVYDIDIFIKLAIDSKLVTVLSKDSEYENLVACLCMSRADMVSRKPQPPCNQNFKTLLATWRRKPITDLHIISMTSVAVLIYGSGICELYQHEVPFNRTFGEYLWSLRLPVPSPNVLMPQLPQGPLPANLV